VKTTTKYGRCLWRGKELPELSESVTPYLDLPGFDVIFASNLHTGNIRFQSVLNTLLSKYSSTDLNIYYPDVEMVETDFSATSDRLLEYVVGDGFSAVIYIFDKLNSFLIYSNTRDCFSFWIVPQNKLSEQETQAWDSEFERHLKTTGIGFGDEGKAYGRRLLREATQLGARSRERFMPMLRILL